MWGHILDDPNVQSISFTLKIITTKNMKKLLIVLALCVFAVSCCEVDHNNSQKKEPEKITATSFKVYTQRGGLVCEYYEFMYHGHKYITNRGEKFLLHSPECSCQY